MRKTLDFAIDMARKNPNRSLPRMAAVLCVPDKRGYVYVGYNSYKTHPLQAKFGRTRHHIHTHAEIDAIRKALIYHSSLDLVGASMYVARVFKDGRPALAKPCEGCERALVEFGIETVEWTE